MEWWDKMMFPVRRIWVGVATRLGIRKSGKCSLFFRILYRRKWPQITGETQTDRRQPWAIEATPRREDLRV
ncbi:hypothetical protein HHK36_002706 [Tetracentron sinense]|uniref:Uncharacterized protein n=1 Tax=Tetracentron sinense TaxID=13715 RepID=A0A834ZMJ5_TETSI|nr:hypothetical protein HHK36_002706 [Tetracentron sinense]